MTGPRLAALDVFRGAAVAAMIVVNNPGNWAAVYPALQHAAWNGCTLADLVFPSFIVIMGVALPFAFDRRRISGERLAAIHRRILSRTAILIAFGLLLNVLSVWPNLHALRIPGVLQRIALTYGITALVVLHVKPRWQPALAVVLLLVHWALLTLVPYGNEAAGHAVSENDNLAAWLDHAVFGAHLLGPVNDPEGLLGVIPSVATAIGGAVAGRWFQTTRNSRSLLLKLFRAAAAALVAGLIWSLVWPMNKTLWSGSYALFATGIALLILTGCYGLVDVRRGGRFWAQPLQWFGVNALAAYVGSEFVARLAEHPIVRHGVAGLSVKDIIFWGSVVPLVNDSGGPGSSLIYALAYVALWIAVVGALYRRGIVIRA